MAIERTTDATIDAAARVAAVSWYHTIDLGNGLTTPGYYDHRPYLERYALPNDLHGKRVLDIGAASGFFAFEFERRGANVVATELPQWDDHDFGPNYRADQTATEAHSYLHQPFDVAHHILDSHVVKRQITIYDIEPETVGLFDLVFCGSVLIHLTDPIKALGNIARVTTGKAILATQIMPEESERPIAQFNGHQNGDSWWIPTRACLELMVVAAGFVGVEWVSDFQLNARDGSPGPYHGVLHAYRTTDGWTAGTRQRDDIIRQQQRATAQPSVHHLQATLAAREQQLAQLKALVNDYERGRFMRLMRWLHTRRNRRN